MRELLADWLSQTASKDSNCVIISGDHGYALFDPIRREHPSQFINVGVAEQALVGIAAGLARVGFLPIVYGLAAFIPIRVLEQIKLDVCFSKLPVVFLGDGAGLVYSQLGASHQCAEDIACLGTLPHLRIYSPADAVELKACYEDSLNYPGPSYIRIGKCDRPAVHDKPLANLQPHFVNAGTKSKNACLVATGSMVSPCLTIAKELHIACISVPQLKPLNERLNEMLSDFSTVIVVEEHSRHGGLASLILESFYLDKALAGKPRLHSLALEDKFSERCGSYQFALSEQGLSDVQLSQRIKAILSPSAKTKRSIVA